MLRRQYEKVGLLQAAKIQTLCRLELSTRIVEQSIREKSDMTAEELRSQRACVVQWSAQRDNVLTELLGDGQDADPLAAIFAADDDEADDEDNGNNGADGPTATERPADGGEDCWEGI